MNVGAQIYCVTVKSAGIRNMAEMHDKATTLLRVKVVRKNNVVYPGAGTPVDEAGSEWTTWGCMGLE